MSALWWATKRLGFPRLSWLPSRYREAHLVWLPLSVETTTANPTPSPFFFPFDFYPSRFGAGADGSNGDKCCEVILGRFVCGGGAGRIDSGGQRRGWQGSQRGRRRLLCQRRGRNRRLRGLGPGGHPQRGWWGRQQRQRRWRRCRRVVLVPDLDGGAHYPGGRSLGRAPDLGGAVQPGGPCPPPSAAGTTCRHCHRPRILRPSRALRRRRDRVYALAATPLLWLWMGAMG